MELTGRQRDFLSKLIDLYRAVQQPLHYSAVATNLHVSPMTAYDMLRLLEERGLVSSEYALRRAGGPGRSNIQFTPTDKARALMAQPQDADWDCREWERIKDRILQSLRQGTETDYKDLLDKLMLRIPESRSPMLFATDMTAAILLSVHALGDKAKQNSMFQALRSLGLPEEVELNALAGLTLGLSLVERGNRRVTAALLSYSRLYQDYLARMSADSKSRLSDFTEEIMRIMEA